MTDAITGLRPASLEAVADELEDAGCRIEEVADVIELVRSALADTNLDRELSGPLRIARDALRRVSNDLGATQMKLAEELERFAPVSVAAVMPESYRNT